MRKSRVLILSEVDETNQLDKACIISLSNNDLDNLKLIQKYLPKDLNKSVFTDKEKEIIDKYNKFIDSLKEKNRSSIIQVDFVLKNIKV